MLHYVERVQPPISDNLLIDCMVFNAVLKQYFVYIAEASAAIHAFLEFF